MGLFDGSYTSKSPAKNHVFFDNMMQNIPGSIGDSHVGQLFGSFFGVPAVILAAGPSLHQGVRSIDEKGILNQALIFCVDAALKPALSLGIKPHFVVTCDPSPITVDFIPDRIPPSTSLLYEISASPGLLARWKEISSPNDSRTISYGLYESGFYGVWELLGRGAVAGSGSVTSTALGIAHRLGCTPIIFAGADFCWAPHGQTHAEGSNAGPPPETIGCTIQDGNFVTTRSFLQSAWRMQHQTRVSSRWFTHYLAADLPSLLHLDSFSGEVRLPDVYHDHWHSILPITRTDWTKEKSLDLQNRIQELIGEIRHYPGQYPPKIVLNVAIEYYSNPENDIPSLLRDAADYVVTGLSSLRWEIIERI